MTSQELIDQTIEQSYEWLEMSTDPTYLMVGILANKVVKLQDHIEYLEKRLAYVSINQR